MRIKHIKKLKFFKRFAPVRLNYYLKKKKKLGPINFDSRKVTAMCPTFYLAGIKVTKPVKASLVSFSYKQKNYLNRFSYTKNVH